MTTPDPKQDTSLAKPDLTKLADWLPILQLPEVGERVCRAAGCGLKTELVYPSIEFRSVGSGRRLALFVEPEKLPEWASAALAFGGLAVLGKDTLGVQVYECGSGQYEVTIEVKMGNSWTTEPDGLPAAVLAALYRVYGPFGDGG